MTTIDEFFSATNPVVDPLWNDLNSMIRQKSAANPRHLQVELGPSEVGHPCARKLAFGLMNAPACNPEYDPLPSIFGVAMHDWLKDAANWMNEQIGYRRWIAETRVNVGPGLSGSSDLYDTQTGTVIDWKTLGKTSYDKYTQDIGPTYRGQIHCYGKGFANAGYDVKRVGIAILPRSSTLPKMHLHLEPYDPSIADRILARLDGIKCLLNDWDVEEHPERYEWFAKTPSDCIWCGSWSPTPTGPLQCSGRVDD